MGLVMATKAHHYEAVGDDLLKLPGQAGAFVFIINVMTMKEKQIMGRFQRENCGWLRLANM